MNTADKIGLLPALSWFADHGFIVTLLICLGLTPVLHCFIGLALEGRVVPLAPSKQFLSFFPGDIFLGLMAAGLLVLARGLPSGDRWYNASWWHIALLIATVSFAVLSTYVEWKSGVYPTKAILSPTKIYHNIFLYGGYGYVIVSTLVAVIAGSSWTGRTASLMVLSLLPGAVWVALVIRDNSLDPATAKVKAGYAHTADWKPIWLSLK